METEQKTEITEDALITEGVLIPGNDLVHFLTRNASYMRLINSKEFKESGIRLEDILDDTFLAEQFGQNYEMRDIMRFMTKELAPKIVALAEAENKANAEKQLNELQGNLEGLLEGSEE